MKKPKIVENRWYVELTVKEFRRIMEYDEECWDDKHGVKRRDSLLDLLDKIPVQNIEYDGHFGPCVWYTAPANHRGLKASGKAYKVIQEIAGVTKNKFAAGMYVQKTAWSGGLEEVACGNMDCGDCPIYYIDKGKGITKKDKGRIEQDAEAVNYTACAYLLLWARSMGMQDSEVMTGKE